MILYQLQCDQNHGFEVWFRDSAAFDKQADDSLLSCPICGSEKISKALMTPRIGRSSARETFEADKTGTNDPPPAPDPQAVAMRNVMIELRRRIQDNCDYVGPGFAEEARRIHYGETDPHSIYGEATREEAKSLVEEGIDVNAVPWIPKENA